MKKLRVELIQVQAARASLELRVEERLEEIERLQEHIEIQKKKELELSQKIEE